MAATAAKIVPRGSIEDAQRLLETDVQIDALESEGPRDEQFGVEARRRETPRHEVLARPFEHASDGPRGRHGETRDIRRATPVKLIRAECPAHDSCSLAMKIR